MLRPGFGEQGGDYGATYESKRHLPFFRHFRERDWPDTADPRRHHPVVVLHNDFYQYFSQDLQSPDEGTWVRTQFLFAVTLVHEVCHAYSMWLNIEHDEPLFRRGDMEAELGYSWESEVLGHICNPVFHDIAGCEMLLSMKAIAYREDRSQPDIVQKLIGNHPLHFNLMNPAHFQDLFRVQSYRGGGFYAGERVNTRRKWIIAIFALSLDWIASWLDQVAWEARRVYWRNTGKYPPTLLQSFVLVYQKKDDVVWVHYPLDPRIQEDFEWIMVVAELEKQRGADKLPCIP
ncbi:hypothetical protein PMIN03_003497 [Paraphaeosphaeria minitans]